MRRGLRLGICGAAVFLLAAGSAFAQRDEHQHGGTAREMPRNAEAHPGPSGYHRLTEPQGWNARPQTVDRNAYHHNYQASRSFRIGPYHRPQGWINHRWRYGEILPRAYWAANYVLADYWLFALEVPPVGCEWVRDDDDALLVNIDTGEILQVEYGVFG